jgi:hypothetical protein
MVKNDLVWAFTDSVFAEIFLRFSSCYYYEVNIHKKIYKRARKINEDAANCQSGHPELPEEQERHVYCGFPWRHEACFHYPGAWGIFVITTFHDLRYEDAHRLSLNQGVDSYNLGNAFYVPSYDVLAVKCQRVMTMAGDLDVIGVREHRHIPEHMPLEDTLNAVEDEGALADVPHPLTDAG